MKTQRRAWNLFAALLIATNISIAEAVQMNWGNHGFWTLGTQKQWNDKELDVAFALFKRLKETYGDQFSLVVQDLHKEGTPKADGTKTAQIVIKIFVSPPNDKIEKELRNVGLTYVK